MTRRFPAILLAASLLAATSAASAAPPVKKLDPDVVDVLAPVQPMQFPPKDLRLRMILEVDATTDVFEGGIGNTEDEIYYKMTGVRIIDRQVKTFNKTLRPSGSKDVWEMGPQTNKKLRRVLFEGTLEYTDSVAMNLVLGEQDNAELKTFLQIAELLGQTLGQLVTPGLDIAQLSNPVKQDVLFKLVNQTTGVMKAIGDAKDQIPGAVAIVIAKHKLSVSTPQSNAKVLESDNDSARIELTGDSSKYTLVLVLTPTSAENPPNREFLDSSTDDCGEPKIKIPTNDGQVVVTKGQRKDVKIPDPRYRWYCGDDGDWSEEWATAPGGTNVADTHRASSGDTITWRWFRDKVPTPDLGP